MREPEIQSREFRLKQGMAQITIERILCPVDFSEFSIGAYGYASSLAQRYRAKLFVQHVVELWRYPSASFSATADLYTQSCQGLLTEGEQQLKEFVKTHARIGVHPECVISEGGFAKDCILSFAQEQKVGLIVTGTHGRRGFDRLMLGSVAETVLRKADCPVLAVHKLSRSMVPSAISQDAIELRRILFCTDLSAYSNGALDYALSLVAEYNSELTLVHVLEDIPKPTRAKETIAKANEDLEKLIPAKAKTKNYRIATTVRIGKAYKEIIELARGQDADLVIMAVRGRNALDLAVFGSTTYRVIQQGTFPVLAVHL